MSVDRLSIFDVSNQVKKLYGYFENGFWWSEFKIMRILEKQYEIADAKRTRELDVF